MVITTMMTMVMMVIMMIMMILIVILKVVSLIYHHYPLIIFALSSLSSFFTITIVIIKMAHKYRDNNNTHQSQPHVLPAGCSTTPLSRDQFSHPTESQAWSSPVRNGKETWRLRRNRKQQRLENSIWLIKSQHVKPTSNMFCLKGILLRWECIAPPGQKSARLVFFLLNGFFLRESRMCDMEHLVTVQGMLLWSHEKHCISRFPGWLTKKKPSFFLTRKNLPSFFNYPIFESMSL